VHILIGDEAGSQVLLPCIAAFSYLCVLLCQSVVISFITRSEVLMAGLQNIQAFWDVSLCQWVRLDFGGGLIPAET
jgi:hypothetical protein